MTAATIRRPRFAGRLYPASLGAWGGEGASAPGPAGEAGRVLLVPHGGHTACGAIMGAGLSSLAATVHEVVLLGPVHDGLPDTPPLCGEDRERWELSSGTLRLGEPWPGIPADRATQDQEHSLEVVAAWLARRPGPSPTVWPVLVTPELGWTPLAGLARLLAAWLAEDAGRALVCTTDLDHYHEQDAARRRHGALLDLLAAGDPHALRVAIDEGTLAPCGAGPTWVFMSVGRRLGWAPRVLGYGWGPEGVGHAVGYAAAVLSDNDPPLPEG